MAERRTRVIHISLLLWIGVSAALLYKFSTPPQVPVQTPMEDKILQRSVDWTVRDGQRWQQEAGDLHIDWEQARGHLILVIDDIGREMEHHEALQALRFPLTFSVLPGSVYAMGAQERLRADRRRPRDIMLHLPMEPMDRAQMQAGAESQEDFIQVGDDAEQIRAKMLAAFEAVPFAVGVNNHMGSRLTADADAMAAIMPILKEHGMFFLDSRTTDKTVAAKYASASGLETFSRQVFLDHVLERDAILAALKRASERSQTETVIAIAHPSELLVEVLTEQLPRLHAQGIGIYALSEWRDRARSKPRARSKE